MPAARYNVIIEPGTTFRRLVEYRRSSGAAHDLSGWTARLVVRQGRPNGVVVADLNSDEDDEVIVDPTAGLITVTLPAAMTKAMPPGRYSYWLDLRSPVGDVTRLLRGTVTIRRA